MTICTWLTLWKRKFSIRVYSFPKNSYDDLHLATLWKKEFSIRIYSFPTNSYDDLHLATLWKRSFQFGSALFLQIPMTICICLDSLEEEFSIRIYSFPTNSYDSAPGDSFPTNSCMTICTWLLLKKEFSIRIYSFPTNSYDDLHLPTL